MFPINIFNSSIQHQKKEKNPIYFLNTDANRNKTQLLLSLHGHHLYLVPKEIMILQYNFIRR